jgi:hypothetical protein
VIFPHLFNDAGDIASALELSESFWAVRRRRLPRTHPTRSNRMRIMREALKSKPVTRPSAPRTKA